MATAEAIEVTNIGPVEHLSIPIPADGGVVVLRGKNGGGKTVTTEAVESLVNGKGGSLQRRDGTKKGSVSWGEAQISVTTRNTRKGELEVNNLSGRMNIAEFVDPGMKDPEAADRRRIKSLVNLMDVKAEVEPFAALLGGMDNFVHTVDIDACEKSLESGDLVGLCADIKREIDKEARKCETLADHNAGKHSAAEEAIEGIDLDAPCDADELQAALEEALNNKTEMLTLFGARSTAKERQEQARKKIAQSSESYAGPTQQDAADKANELNLMLSDQQLRVEELRGTLEVAEAEFDRISQELKQADAVYTAAVNHEKAMGHWRESVEQEIPEGPSLADLDAAQVKIGEARAAIEQGALVRNAKEQAADAADYELKSKENRADAKSLRKASKDCDKVLSEMVSAASDTLWIADDRLMLKTARGETFFDDLSHGEKWKVALDIAIERVGRGGIIVVVQEAWEGLQPSVRVEIAEQVNQHGVTIITAQCDDGELRAEVEGGDSLDD